MKRCLERLISRSHPDHPEFYAQLMRKIPDLRTLNTLHSEKLIGCNMDACNNFISPVSVASRAAKRWTPRSSLEAVSPNSSFGRCGSSSPLSHSPTSVTSSETTRAADSGVESGSDCKFDLDTDSRKRMNENGKRGLDILVARPKPLPWDFLVSFLARTAYLVSLFIWRIFISYLNSRILGPSAQCQ